MTQIIKKKQIISKKRRQRMQISDMKLLPKKSACLQPSSSCALLAVGGILFLLAQISQLTQVAARSRVYDPEQQDGIPVFSARSVPQQLSNSLDDDWTSSDQMNKRPAQRRQADADLDDGLEDEDEDEYKSGSSPQESIENPSYGESSRAARDGDEIEDFFDKHLGPPQEATAADESVASVTHQEVPAVDPDTDDQYEAAASSPLTSIFHSLLHGGNDHQHEHKHKHKHNKRPFLHFTTSSAADSDSSSDSTSSSASPSNQHDSTKAPSGAVMKTSQSAQSYVESAPGIALAFAPAVAASSQIIGQDASGQETQQDQQDSPTSPAAAAPPLSSGVREIYIGRRPTVMKYLQQAYGQQQQPQKQQHYGPLPGYTTAGSSQIYRGAPGRQQQQVVYEQQQQQQDQQADQHYAQQPPIAASYAYQREQPSQANADDEQTVTYGLSFGGSPAAAAADEDTSSGSPQSEQEQDSWQGGSADSTEAQQQEQAEHGPAQQMQGYVPYNTRYSTSSTRAHNNYYNNVAQYAPHYRQAHVHAMGPHQQQQPQQQMVMVQQQPVAYQQYTRGGSTRYHRDPSESANNAATATRSAIPYQQQQQQQPYYAGYQQVGAAQYRTNQSKRKNQAKDEYDDADETRTRERAQQIAERQQLLASLDREIKASPHYHSNEAAATSQATAHTGTQQARSSGKLASPSDNRQHLVAFKAVRKSYKGDDLDSYNSFHSEVDPHKTFTSTSRMINDPTGSLLGGNGRQIPATTPDQDQSAKQSANNDASNMNSMSRISNNNNNNGNQVGQHVNANLLTGPLSSSIQPVDTSLQFGAQDGDLLRNTNNNAPALQAPIVSNDSNANASAQDNSSPQGSKSQDVPNSRVRREDADEREIDNDVDEDGVWVDDDDDDDNKQQSSDVNETAQDPEGEEEEEAGEQPDAANNVPNAHHQMNPPGVIGGPHGYELSPNDLMIYHG